MIVAIQLSVSKAVEVIGRCMPRPSQCPVPYGLSLVPVCKREARNKVSRMPPQHDSWSLLRLRFPSTMHRINN